MTLARPWLALGTFAALGLIAGCSSSGGSSSGPGSGAMTTVAVRTVSGAAVLVDAAGRTLYTSDQERSAGKVLCTSSACTAIWMPVTVSAGRSATGPASVSARLTTVSRPGGARQAAFNGAPLYTFRFDHSAGDMNGNGQKDSFDGTNFVWHAATVGAAAPASSSSAPAGGGGRY